MMIILYIIIALLTFLISYKLAAKGKFGVYAYTAINYDKMSWEEQKIARSIINGNGYWDSDAAYITILLCIGLASIFWIITPFVLLPYILLKKLIIFINNILDKLIPESNILKQNKK